MAIKLSSVEDSIDATQTYITESKKVLDAQKQRSLNQEINIAQDIAQRAGSYSDLEKRLEHAEAAITQSQQDIVFHDKELIFMDTKIDAELGRIGASEAKADQAVNNFADLRGNVEAIENQVSVMDKAVATQDKRISLIQGTLGEDRYKVGELKDKIAKIGGVLEGAVNEFAET